MTRKHVCATGNDPLENAFAAVIGDQTWPKERLFGVMIEALFLQGLLSERQRAQVRATLCVDMAMAEKSK